MSFRILLTSLSLLVSLILSGCREETSVEKASKEGILIMGVGTEPKTLDPQRATSVSEALVLQSLFEGLCSADPNDDTRPQQGVARSWIADDTATTWTFQLRSRAKWSDGTPLTACDFVFSYHRILHPSGGAKYADMLYVLKNAEAYNKDWRGYILCGQDPDFPQSWEELKQVNWQGMTPEESQEAHARPEREDIEPPSEPPADRHPSDFTAVRKGLDRLNLQELRQVASGELLFLWPDIITPHTRRAILERLTDHAEKGFPDLWSSAQVGVEAPDEYQLRLILRSPTTYLPLLTRHFTWMPVPAHILNTKGDLGLNNTEWTRPGKMISNGPFILDSWRFNDSITVSKNLNYRRADDVELNGMKFLPIVNGFTETRMFFDGKLHATNNIPAEMMAYARKKGGSDFQLKPYYATTLYRLNTARKPLDDKRVRQALACAINQKHLVDKVAQGAGTPATAFTPPTSAYTPPDLIHYDPEKARRLLAEAGYPGGKGFPRLSILTTSREVQKIMTEAVQAQWKKELGIEMEIRSSEWASYKMAQQNGDYDIAYGSWSGDFPDASTFLELWTGDNGNNNTGWSDPRYEEAIRKARFAVKDADRIASFAEAERILLEESPVIPLFWSKRAYMLHPDVKGWGPLQLDTRPYARLSLFPASNATH